MPTYFEIDEYAEKRKKKLKKKGNKKMSIFFIITIFIVTLYTISILGQYECDTKASLICAAINIAYIAACVYLTTRGI